MSHQESTQRPGKAVPFMFLATLVLALALTNSLAQAAPRSGQEIVDTICAECHRTGVDGAPVIGDRSDWIPRIARARGLDELVDAAIKGHGYMPARGGFPSVTDAEIRAAIIHMYYPYPMAPVEAVATPEPADPNRRIIGPLDINLGVVSAATIRSQYPPGSPERSMHGGVPDTAGEHHLNISIFDNRTGAMVEDAQVTVTVKGSRGSVRRNLELVTIENSKSYGHYFQMPAGDSYAITVQIRKPDLPRPVTANFTYAH